MLDLEFILRTYLSNCIHLIHVLAILSLIPWIQEVVYLYMLIIVTCLMLSVCGSNLAFKLNIIILLATSKEKKTKLFYFQISHLKK